MTDQQHGGNHTREVWKGIGLTGLLHLLLLLFPTAYFAIGVVQLVYMIPALILVRHNRGMVQGMLIAMGITFLVNAACFGYVIIQFS